MREGDDLLYEYMYNKEVSLINDLTQAQNNCCYRTPTSRDYLLMLRAQLRMETAAELFSEIRTVIKIERMVSDDD